MSTHASRLIKLFKIAVEQGLLFNLPPAPTKHPETGMGNARRVYQKPHSDGTYTCSACEINIAEDDIAAWKEAENQEETFYNPKLDPNYSSKVLGALYEAKELLHTFVGEFEKLPPIPEYDMSIEGSWDKHYEIKQLYERLIKDFNTTLRDIPKEYFKGEEIYKPLLSVYNRTLSTYFSVHYGGAGRTLEDAHSIGEDIERLIQKIKAEGLEPVQYSSIIMEPICADCYSELSVKCDWCGDAGLFQGEDDDATFHKVNGNDYLCKKCYENASWCEECNELMHSDESFYDERNERSLCQSCYNNLKSESYNIAPVEKFIEELDKEEVFLPVDSGQIEKTILPKILLPMRNKPFSIEAVERQADKAKLTPALKTYLMQVAKSESFSTMEDLISKLMRQADTDKQYKEKYPQIKRFNKIPLDIRVAEEDDRDMPSFTITIRPTQAFIDYSEALFPGNGKEAYRKISSGGHHNGAMAYARIGYDEDEDAFVINNLQTDADMQKLVRTTGDLPDSLKDMESALRWWLKQFENWPAQLLDISRQFGQQMGKAVYLTSFDMQKKKWRSIPERSKDVYDRIPAQMGFQPEDVDMNVESLGKDNYDMYRIARLVRTRAIKKLF